MSRQTSEQHRHAAAGQTLLFGLPGSPNAVRPPIYRGHWANGFSMRR